MLATKHCQRLAPKTMLRLSSWHMDPCLHASRLLWLVHLPTYADLLCLLQWLTYWVVYAGLTSLEAIVQSIFM